jgi:hypothetical protein
VRWCKGDPDGFLEISAPNVVYFDPFLERRIDGLDALTRYYDALRWNCTEVYRRTTDAGGSSRRTGRSRRRAAPERVSRPPRAPCDVSPWTSDRRETVSSGAFAARTRDLGPAAIRALVPWRRSIMVRLACLVALLAGFASTAAIADPAARPQDIGLLDSARESLFGDVYAQPSTWERLTLADFFSKGWTRPWASPPNGEGGAPRQGWLNAYDGVFYRLGILTGSYGNDFHNNGASYTGGLTLYTPLNARFELRTDVPFVASNRDLSDPDHHDRETHFGDLQITPRFLLHEDRNVTQTLNVTLRAPTGSEDNGNDFASVVPTYELWANLWRGLVLRGGAGLTLPYSNREDSGARDALIGNLALGYYFTPHDWAPVGDFVTYLSANVTRPWDDRGTKDPTLTLTPGFRTHLGANWYLLGGVEVPMTHEKAFDYQVLGGLMKVF